MPVEDWVLEVDGLVERPLTIDRAAWSDLERREVTADFHCVTGWTAEDVRWGGVAPSVLLDRPVCCRRPGTPRSTPSATWAGDT